MTSSNRLPTEPSSWATRAWLLVIVVLVAVPVVLFVVRPAWRGETPNEMSSADPFPLTPISASRYRNTGPDAHYVGSEVCRGCHLDRHASFRRTGMGRSMAALDPASEPPDATYDHPPSKRRYQVARRDGKVWHRELLMGTGAAEVLLAEYPLTHVVGSGRHSRTYLAEAEGFLVESPATWYTARKAWDMSPGYAHPEQQGFERAVGVSCLVCHAGRVEAVGNSLHRLNVIEAAIGCERCHGPGSLHAALRRGPPRPDLTDDDTIVNPAGLPRDLAEAICQQCHLRPTAVVVARGRSLSDFRPGLPLQDFLLGYELDDPDSAMTVVGHVEQLHLSKCYRSSSKLTCLTCHDPHNEPEEQERVAHYRATCLTSGCHGLPDCKVTEARRQKESPDNNCVPCHMPRSPTEIPHLAFTHHRIGVHDRPAAVPGRTGSGELRPFHDLSRVSDIDQRRSLGLGYLEAANREKDPTRAGRFRERAMALLHEVRAAGLRDAVVEVSLARLVFDTGLGDPLPLADGALADAGLDGQERCNALFLRADALAARGRHAEAVAALRELVLLRRHSVDWLLLADCEKALGHTEAWEEALTAAARINPRLWKVHQGLAEHNRGKGNADRATWHQIRAVQ
jgi:hypothetical protein